MLDQVLENSLDYLHLAMVELKNFLNLSAGFASPLEVIDLLQK